MIEKRVVSPNSEWSKQEQWIWCQACKGKIADFKDRDRKELDPRQAETWEPSRIISSRFLEEIVHTEKYKKALPCQGLRILGAWIVQDNDDPIDFHHVDLDWPLWIEQSRIEKPINLFLASFKNTISFDHSFLTSVNFSAVKVDRDVGLTGTLIEGKLDMNGIIITGHLFMRTDNNDSPATFQDVEMVGGQVGGRVNLNGAVVTGKLDMNGLKVKEHLFMRTDDNKSPATFHNVELVSAHVDEQVDLRGTLVKGKLNMNGIKVGHGLYMRTDDKESPATFQDVELVNAKVSGQVSLNGAIINGKLDMNGLIVERGLCMRTDDRERPAIFQDVALVGAIVNGRVNFSGATIKGKLDMINMQVNENLDMTCKLLNQVDLTSATIKGLLDFGKNECISWERSGALVLRHAEAGAFRAPAWHLLKKNLSSNTNNQPPCLELDGFTYIRLGGWLNIDDDAGMNTWEATKLTNLLEVDKTFTPQPYHQMAKVLQDIGQKEKANTILFRSKQRERLEAWKNRHYITWGGYWLLELTIGYGFGYRYFYSLFWIYLFTYFGAWVLASPEQVTGDQLWCSLDRFLPIIKFDEKHFFTLTDCNLKRYYFYVHAVIGYVLTCFIVAGLSGITKK